MAAANWMKAAGLVIGLGLMAGCAPNMVATTPLTGAGQGSLGVPYYLPRGLISLTVTRDNGALEVGFSGDVALHPDPDHAYVLTYQPSALSADKLTISTTKTGLLQLVDSTSDDRSGVVVTKLIEFATEVAKAGFGVMGSHGRDEEADFSLEVSFDPTRTEDVSRVRALLGRYGVDFATLPGSGPVNSRLAAPKGSAGATCQSGPYLCFRPVIPYQYTFGIAQGDNEIVRSVLVNLPNDAPVITLDVSRYAFVQSKQKLTFESGMLTKVEVEKPSEAEGFMSIPIDVAKSIVSIPAALLDFKVTSLGKDKQLLQAQQSLIDAQLRLLDKQEEALEHRRSSAE